MDKGDQFYLSGGPPGTLGDGTHGSRGGPPGPCCRSPPWPLGGGSPGTLGGGTHGPCGGPPGPRSGGPPGPLGGSHFDGALVAVVQVSQDLVFGAQGSRKSRWCHVALSKS